MTEELEASKVQSMQNSRRRGFLGFSSGFIRFHGLLGKRIGCLGVWFLFVTVTISITRENRTIKNTIHALNASIFSDWFPVEHGFVFPIFSTFYCGKMEIQHGVDFQQASSKFVPGKAEWIYTTGERGHLSEQILRHDDENKMSDGGGN